jgi:hypothetical protein
MNARPVDMNTCAPHVAIRVLIKCIKNAKRAGDALAVKKFEVLMDAYEQELNTGIFPTEQMNARLENLVN